MSAPGGAASLEIDYKQRQKVALHRLLGWNKEAPPSWLLFFSTTVQTWVVLEDPHNYLSMLTCGPGTTLIL
ncbi:hypothetical protein FF1_034877 [Malus domestica]